MEIGVKNNYNKNRERAKVSINLSEKENIKLETI